MEMENTAEKSFSINLPKIRKKKKKALNELRTKMENAKLNLIYTELEEMGINIEKNFTSVNELTKYLKSNLNELDFNKVMDKINHISESVNKMVESLDKGSTSAFTKFMSSDLTKTIGKTLGISLAGRTALLLAPTIGTKALVGAALGGYSIYKVIKNRKEIIKANETNELNNILMDLEATKKDGKYLDTRFSEEMQNQIILFLSEHSISFENTGYLSLRQAIYSLPNKEKKELCVFLNNKLGKVDNLENRLKKAKKKLNVVASSAAGISAGGAFGIHLANIVNGVDPGITAGILNGTLLGAWIEKQTNTSWYTALNGALGVVGSEVLQHIPLIGSYAEKFFALENIASFAAIGATGGLIVSTTLGIASAIKRIYENSKNRKENNYFMSLDKEKYASEDEEELKKIQDKLEDSSNIIEFVIVDVMTCYLKDININLNPVPKNVNELEKTINKLNNEDKQKAKEMLHNLKECLEDKSFLDNLKKAGSISIGLFTAGLAALSIYDILKGGTFLPELSQKLFPNNNIYTSVKIPDGKDVPLDNVKDADIIKENQELYNKFGSDDYKVEDNGDAVIGYGYEYWKNNHGNGIGSDISSASASSYIADAGTNMNFVDNILNFFGFENTNKTLIPDYVKISEEISNMDAEKLLDFYRFFGNAKDTDSDLYKVVSSILSSNNNLNKISEYINGFTKTQEMYNFINDLSHKLSAGYISLMTVLEALGAIQKKENTETFLQEENNSKNTR